MKRQNLRTIKFIATTSNIADTHQEKNLSVICNGLRHSATVRINKLSFLTVLKNLIFLKINKLKKLATVLRHSATVLRNLQRFSVICNTSSVICNGLFHILQHFIRNLQHLATQSIVFTKNFILQSTNLKIYYIIDSKAERFCNE
jgi:hypothetical protein